ncbi:hypothetical protein B0H14DRAFT_114491 [Mycena olivaceomarginata]|nr:hypothetical protein B0H14DRAFT_114491 [Mycena olivaceomarginata]
MRDRWRCARVSRVRCRAALGIVPNVLWDAGGASCSRYARRWRARCTSGVWRGIASGFTVCISEVRCRAAWGHGVPATVCTVRRSVPAISLAWWRIMRTAAFCEVLPTVPPRLRQSGTLSSSAGYAGPSAVTTYGGSSASHCSSNYSASSMNYPSTPPAHTYTSSSSPSNAYNLTSTPYSITLHSTSSSASVHNTPAPGPMSLRPLYACGSSCEPPPPYTPPSHLRFIHQHLSLGFRRY